MTKICKYCNQPFETQSARATICKRDHFIVCPVCGESRLERRADKLLYVLANGPTACSYVCRVKRTQQTSLAKYGCRAPGNNPEAREKSRQTMQARLGVPYAMQSPEVRAKSQQVLMERLGVPNASKSLQVKAKRKQTNQIRYGDVLPFNRPECYQKQHETMMARYGVPIGVWTPNATTRGNRISKTNRRIQEVFQHYGINTVLEKYLDGKMYDLAVTDSNILIEVDPSYTHSSQPNHWNKTGLNKYYHRDKTITAETNGYRCIHIWDWDNVDLIARQLAPKTHINAADLKVYRLTTQAASEFLTENDIHGTCRGQILCLGLVKDDQIYQVITFGKAKQNKGHNIQILRMCTKAGWEVDDGLDMLSTVASRDFGVTSCIVYVDRSKLYSNECELIGMTRTRVTPPSKIWSKGSKFMFETERYAHHRNETNSDLLADGWLPVYNCGQLVYEFK